MYSFKTKHNEGAYEKNIAIYVYKGTVMKLIFFVCQLKIVIKMKKDTAGIAHQLFLMSLYINSNCVLLPFLQLYTAGFPGGTKDKVMVQMQVNR